MFTENTHPTITVTLEDGDSYNGETDAFVDVFNSVSDSIEITNDGFPVYLGNSYAQYEFTAYNDGEIFTYAFGPHEFSRLMEDREVILAPSPWNYLPDMPDFIRPAWAV